MKNNRELSPSELLAQSARMSNIHQEYETLFTQVASTLHGLNDCWSADLASNFSGKILAVQKALSNVSTMMANGAAAAKYSAMTFAAPGAVYALLNGQIGEAGTGTTLMSWLSDMMQQDGGFKGSDLIIGELSKLTGVDAACAKEVIEKMASGDYEGAMQAAAEKGLDWVSSAMVGGAPSDSLLGQLQELTGSDLGLTGLEKAYYENFFGNPLENAYNIVKDQYSGDPDPIYQLKQLGEMAWNIGPGAVIETCGDAALDIVKNIPIIGDYYTQQGVTTGEDAIGVAIGTLTELVTGDSEAAAADANYYKEHGGIAAGVVDGVIDIGGYVAERIGSLWHSGIGN